METVCKGIGRGGLELIPHHFRGGLSTPHHSVPSTPQSVKVIRGL